MTPDSKDYITHYALLIQRLVSGEHVDQEDLDRVWKLARGIQVQREVELSQRAFLETCGPDSGDRYDHLIPV